MTGPTKKKLAIGGAIALVAYLLWRRSRSTAAPRIELIVEDAFGRSAQSSGYEDVISTGPITSPSQLP